MSRPRRARVTAPQVSETAWAMLNDFLLPDDDGCGGWERYSLEYGGSLTTPSLQSLWAEFGPGILPNWVAEQPGTRPTCWWRWDAPEPRRRLGGIGTPALGYNSLHLGVPTRWVSAWAADYYNGRARDVHGELIPSDHKEGDFDGAPPDPRDPPRYESQASYLERHGLLLPAERRRLKAADFAPELVPVPAQDEP